jgi:hypothetical protein
MRALIIAAITAAGLGLAGMTSTIAAPANGVAINNAAATTAVVEQARWRWHRHHRRCWWHHRRLVCW